MLTNEPLCAVFVYCFLAALGLCCGLQSSLGAVLAALGLCCGLQSSLVRVCELSSWSTWA